MGAHDEARLDTKFIDFARQMNLYLNHFPKHEKYGLAQSIRTKAYEMYGYIDVLHLELSRHSLHKTRRGLNFVGYRTWVSTRFVRKHSLYAFTQAARRGAMDAVISIIGHARHTASLRHLLTTLKGKYHALFCRLPKICKQHHHPLPGAA